jgi:hypothetical protein
VQRAIRLHYERVVGVALVLGVLLPLYFLLTGFAVAGADQRTVVECGATITALGATGHTTADPSGACHAGAVDRLHLAGGYFVACLAVAFIVWLVAGARERALNRAWADARRPSRWISTPGQVWIFAALLFVVLAGAAQGI